MSDFDKIIGAVIACVKEVDADEFTKFKITYTLLKIYESEKHLDDVCLILDKNKRLILK